MSVTHKFSCWIRETRFEALLCLKLWWVQAGGVILRISRLTPVQHQPSVCHPNCIELSDCIERERRWWWCCVLLMLAGPLPEPQITKQCWSVVWLVRPHTLLPASQPFWRQHWSDDLLTMRATPPPPTPTAASYLMTPHTSQLVVICRDVDR